MVFDMLHALPVGEVVGPVERLEDIGQGPGMLFGQLSFDHHAMVDGVEAGLLIIAHALRPRVGKKRLDVRMIAEIGGAAIDQIGIDQIVHHGVELA